MARRRHISRVIHLNMANRNLNFANIQEIIDGRDPRNNNGVVVIGDRNDIDIHQGGEGYGSDGSNDVEEIFVGGVGGALIEDDRSRRGLGPHGGYDGPRRPPGPGQHGGGGGYDGPRRPPVRGRHGGGGGYDGGGGYGPRRPPMGRDDRRDAPYPVPERRPRRPRLPFVEKLSSDESLRPLMEAPFLREVAVPVDGFSEETEYIERSGRLHCHALTFADGHRCLMATAGDGGASLACLLLSLFYQTTTENCGVYKTWLSMMDDPRFSSFSGPLTNRMRMEILVCASTVCFIMARGPHAMTGSGCFPSSSLARCVDFSRSMYDRGQYDRAYAMAATIANYLNFEKEEDQITAEQIMQYDLNSAFSKRLLPRLKRHGIFSHSSGAVGSDRDIEGINLPLFLFLDALFPDSLWRGHCSRHLVRVPDRQLASIERNVTLNLAELEWD